MAQELPSLIDQSLDSAALQQFTHLFLNLMKAESSDKEAMERFERGLRKLIDTYYKTAELVEELKVEYAVPDPRS